LRRDLSAVLLTSTCHPVALQYSNPIAGTCEVIELARDQRIVLRFGGGIGIEPEIEICIEPGPGFAVPNGPEPGPVIRVTREIEVEVACCPNLFACCFGMRNRTDLDKDDMRIQEDLRKMFVVDPSIRSPIRLKSPQGRRLRSPKPRRFRSPPPGPLSPDVSESSVDVSDG
jgi:hypothetical protein